MPKDREHGPQRVEQRPSQEKKYPSSSSFVVPPPSTLRGYTLQLTHVEESARLKPQERSILKRNVPRFLQEQKKKGKKPWDNPKVHITSTQVKPSLHQGGDEEVILYTAALTTYFQHAAGIDHHTPRETAEKFTHSGVTVFVITGDNQLILASRPGPDKVSVYPYTITATASGSLEGKPEADLPRLPDGNVNYDEPLPKLLPPTPEDISQQALGELQDETGIPPAYLTHPETKIKIIGMAKDPLKHHTDVLFIIQLPKEATAEQMLGFHKTEKKNGNHNEDPMAGHLIPFDATPERIKHFLTIPTGWDGNTELGLTAVGKMLIMERMVDAGFSEEYANAESTKWQQQTEQEIQVRQQERDAIARKYRRTHITNARWTRWHAIDKQLYYRFYENNPDERQVQKEIRRQARQEIDDLKKRPRRYYALIGPKDQGFKDVKSALQEKGYLQ